MSKVNGSGFGIQPQLLRKKGNTRWLWGAARNPQVLISAGFHGSSWGTAASILPSNHKSWSGKRDEDLYSQGLMSKPGPWLASLLKKRRKVPAQRHLGCSDPGKCYAYSHFTNEWRFLDHFWYATISGGTFCKSLASNNLKGIMLELCHDG